MLKTQIKDYKGDVLTQFRVIEECIGELEDQDNWKDRLSEILSQINRSNPSLMFYGIYNAGKSSVLNAIFGEEKASVNDIPETHKVTEYKWKNYILVDTPGLDGPPEDERITLPQIKKRDIIMFIIDDSDNFDSLEITQRIIEILDSGKPCIIVINKKNDSDRDRILGIKAKMEQNIRSMKNVSFDYDFIAVDAQTALKAKKQEKKGLLEDSNIEELESCISRKLMSVDEIKLLKVPLRNMQELCGDIKKSLEEKLKEENGKRLKELIEEVTYIKNNTVRSFNAGVDAKTREYVDILYDRLSSGKDASFNKNQCEKEIHELAQEHMERYCKESNVKVVELAEKWRLELDSEKERMALDEQNEISGYRREKKDELSELLDALEDMPILIPSPGPVPIPIPLPVVIKVLKGLKQFIFGGGDDDSEERAYEMNQREKENANKRMFALKELRSNLLSQMDQFAEQVKMAFEERIGEVYGQRKKELEVVIEKQSSEETQLLRLGETLSNCEARVKMLIEGII